MKKVLFIAAALFVCTSFSFASDLESESFDVYSLSPLTASALDYAVMPLSATSWDTSDQAHLAAIRNALTSSSTISGGNILGNLIQIRTAVTDTTDTDLLQDIRDSFKLNVSANEGSLIDTVRDLESLLDTLNRVTVPYANDKLDLIYQDVGDIEDASSVISSNSISSASSLESLFNAFSSAFSAANYYPRISGQNVYSEISWRQMMGYLYTNFMVDGLAPYSSNRTMYSYIKNLSDTLASPDDVALANAQKSNREEIEDSFLNGSSGSTSLGASDFGDLSDVGGTVNDTLSLNGQASISSFTSGLAGADHEGQNWFSAATRDSLDSVSGGISTFALDDPYNMEGWEEQYFWVLGGE